MKAVFENVCPALLSVLRLRFSAGIGVAGQEKKGHIYQTKQGHIYQTKQTVGDHA